jgi:hypothetical protein
MLRKLFLMLAIVAMGAAMLVPVFWMLDLEPQMLDFTLRVNDRPLHIPATYSLCASAGLGLLYWFLKR